MSTTAADLKELAAQLSKSTGQTYVTDDTTLYKLMTRRLKAMSAASFRLFHHAIDFTMSTNVSTYDFTASSSAFQISSTNRKLYEVTNVVINGMSLLDFDGKVGRVSQIDMERWKPDYRTSDADVPSKWWVTAPGVLHVWAKPTATAISDADNYVAAFYSHPSVTAGSDAILFPDEDLEWLAMDLAGFEMNAYAQAGSDGWNKAQQYLNESAAWARTMKAAAIDEHASPSVRGESRQRTTWPLAYW